MNKTEKNRLKRRRKADRNCKPGIDRAIAQWAELSAQAEAFQAVLVESGRTSYEDALPNNPPRSGECHE